MNNSKVSIGIIGGSGLYEILDNPTPVEVKTPFDSDPIIVQSEEFDDRILYFVPRHGKGHSIAPHLVNYKANIYALFKLGIDRILSTNAVGSVIVKVLSKVQALASVTVTVYEPAVNPLTSSVVGP